MTDAYENAVAARLKIAQQKQRAMSPQRVGQKCLRDFCGRASGFGAVMPPDAARDFVRLVEAIVVAERAVEAAA